MDRNLPWERIIQIIRETDSGNPNRFSFLLGLKRSENLYQIKKGNHGISKILASRIVDKFPQYNIGWIVTGEGMPREIDKPPKTIPFYSDYRLIFTGVSPSDELIIDTAYIPDAEIATFNPGGSAIDNKIPPGSYVFLKEEGYIMYGMMYLIHTEDFTTIRIVRKIDSKYLSLESSRFNDSNDSIIINHDQISKSFRVVNIVVDLRP